MNNEHIVIRGALIEVKEVYTPYGKKYHLITKRGTVYELIPRQHNKHLFFVIRSNRRQAVCKFRGIKWFTDKNGHLEEVI